MSNKITGIYAIKDIELNKMVYVGESFDVLKRIRRHQTIPFNKKSRNYNIDLYKYIREKGLNCFDFIILEETIQDKKIMKQRETFWINHYDTFFDGMNQKKLDDNGKEVFSDIFINKLKQQEPWNKGIKATKEIKEHLNNISPRRQVMCIELNKKFNSLADAGRYFNVTPENIYGGIKLNRKRCGYTWKYI